MPIFEIPNGESFIFIHIPKTGGTSIEHYFIQKGVSKAALQTNGKSCTIAGRDIDVSLQHQRYRNIQIYTDVAGIDISKMRKFAVVRNPYTRCISDLFFNKLIKKESTQKEVYEVLKQYFANYDANVTAYDNHARPQIDFLLNKNNIREPTIVIMRTETLNKDMIDFGFTDFDIHTPVNSSMISSDEYFKYLNAGSIKLINDKYARDFAEFGYSML